MVDPMRANWRSENAEPRSKKSRTDSELPTLALPKTEIVEPPRMKLRRDTVDPK